MAGNSKIDRLVPELFLDGPGEFLTKSVARAIREECHFKQVFGESVVDYDREDFSIRELPALRVYNMDYSKKQESHYIEGELKVDVILPPLLRREETESVQSQLASALLQQFRRPSFFEAMLKAVPGLNELGKVFSVDKSLGFQNESMTDECPVTHISLNFRIDLKEWDAYLESQGRTKEDPFDVTLENLRKIASTIQGIRVDADLGTKDVELATQQAIGGI